MVDFSKPKPGAKIAEAFREKEQITLPTLSTRGGGTFHVCFLSAFEKPDIDKKGNAKLNDDGEPVILKISTVFDLAERHKAQFVLGAVLWSELKTHFAGNFLGQCVKVIVPAEKAKDKRYKIPILTELFPPDWLDEELGKLLPPTGIAELRKIKT